MRTRERVLSILAILGSLMAATGLILLSIFDTKRYARLHRLFLLIFMLGVALSAIFTVIEVSLMQMSLSERVLTNTVPMDQQRVS
jgi:Frag1/DRAM/Sfk1 family